MLKVEDNELLTRVGPKTRMGEMLREYWMPACRSESLVADGAPQRVRLVGENFVAFRATDGGVGFLYEACPHRGASLALGRNEDNGLRCIFHGWKMDVCGKVVDVPAEPAETRDAFAARLKVGHFPTHEAGGMVWVYLGKQATPPVFPDFEFNNLPASHVCARRGLVHYNWLQGLEAHIDASHVGIPIAMERRREGLDITNKTRFTRLRLTVHGRRRSKEKSNRQPIKTRGKADLKIRDSVERGGATRSRRQPNSNHCRDGTGRWNAISNSKERKRNAARRFRKALARAEGW
jgi:nitrite reductase/ring-hydroxylating ferredoxin subunit